MLRLTLIPIILLITVFLLAILVWFVTRKIKQGIEGSLKKGAKIANDKKQKWDEKEQHKKLPDIVQKGFKDYQQINDLVLILPEEWKNSLLPITRMTKDILDEVAFEYSSMATSNKKRKASDKKLNSIRSFFIHSLDALLQFVEKLQSDHKKMTTDELDKARQNINVFKADLLNHQETLHKVRRFDFDVVMDVIKARLKR